MRSQRGQVLPLAVVCLFVCALFLYFAVSSGQLVDEKIRITNAADAAAYSAATVEARALNFAAFANRAIIANQVALAQALSVASWTDYFADLWLNLDHVTERLGDLVPPDDLVRWSELQATLVGEAYATAYGGVDPRDIAQYVNVAAGAIITASDLASRGLQLSETLVRESLRGAEVEDSGARQAALAREAARISEPEAAVSIVPLSHEFDRLVKSYDGDERSRLADVTRRSLDDFSRQRQWTLRNLLGFLDSRRMERTGGTDLRDPDHWVASDMLTYHASGGLFSGSTDDTLATGFASVGGAPLSTSGSDEYYLPALFSGLPAIQDVRDTTSTDPKAGISAYVSKPRNVGPGRVGPGGRLAVFDGAVPGKGVAALARAEVFFERPDARADGREERGSTFDPYWRVRLIAPVGLDEAYAAGRQGGVLLP
ncbi:MAG: hypothetical protein JSS24_00350 [Proteobacteria bacterium]|nr:hypothetical protein [Pseudomonadota bacterium]